MIFYQKKRKSPKVWFGKNKSDAIRFTDGVYETNDPKEIKLLKQAGFAFEQKPKKPAPVEKKAPVKKTPIFGDRPQSTEKAKTDSPGSEKVAK